MSSPLFTKPRLKQCFAVEIVETRAVFLFTEHRQFVFEGEVYTSLIPFLDGQHSFTDILSAIGGQFTTQELFNALTQLSRRGCLVEAEGGIPEHASFWDYIHNDPSHVQKCFKDASVSFISRSVHVTDLDLKAAFDAAGLEVSNEAPLLVVAVDDYLQPDLKAINAEALKSKRSWAIIKPVGMVLWVGPIFRPEETGCWHCLEHRLRANRQVETFIQDRAHAPVNFVTSKASMASTLSTGLNLAALEIAKALVLDAPNKTLGEILTLDLCTLQFAKHTFVKRPQCPVCGSPETRKQTQVKPIELVSRPLTPFGWRTQSAQMTFDRYKHHISPISGIVTSLIPRDVEQLQDTTIYNYVAGHYFPMINNNINLLRVNAFVRSGGKGATEIQAKTGALCESIERYSGICWGDEPLIRASFNELAPNAYHVKELAQFSDKQYAQREQWNASQEVEREMVPERLDDNDEIAWTQAWSLTNHNFKYLPMGYCYYGFRDTGRFVCYCDSNGNAAGNTLEEAILHGIVELVERDSVALWWYNRLQRQAIDTASFQLPYWDKMETYYHNVLQRELHVLDLTTDLKIPTFAVISRRVNHSTEDIIIGLGAHIDAKQALTRALDEANQYVPALCEMTAEGTTRYRMNEKDIIQWWKTATYATQFYLLPDPNLPPKTLAEFPALSVPDLKAHVLCCVGLIADAEMEVLVIDQTRPDIGLPVVKVVIPGLRHFWRRLAPGRLYDVPVKMGWLSQPHREDELNPISCFV